MDLLLAFIRQYATIVDGTIDFWQVFLSESVFMRRDWNYEKQGQVLQKALGHLKESQVERSMSFSSLEGRTGNREELKRGGIEPPNSSPIYGSFPEPPLSTLSSQQQLHEKLNRIQKSDVFVECYLLLLDKE